MCTVSKSTTTRLSPELKKFLKRTEPLRRQAVYWATLREWSELPLWKRLITKKPRKPEVVSNG